MFIDTHAHLNFEAFKNDYQKAIDRAFKAGVKGIINVGSNLSTSLEAIRIAHEYKKSVTNSHEGKVYAAVSLHPIHVTDEDFDYNKYLTLAKDKYVVAIGETGIDLYHNKKSIDLQKEIFIKLLDIAREVKKPVIIHSREADSEVLEILKATPATPCKLGLRGGRGVLHCFGRGWDVAEKFLKMGFLLSFTGNITYHLTPEREEMIKKVPLEKIMIETDCPFMVPEPQRSDRTLRPFDKTQGKHAQGLHAKGVRNEPAYVVEVAKKIAEIKKIPLAEVEKTTTQNAADLFKLSTN